MNDIVNAARNWIGTPYVHQACKQGIGADCLGLVRGIWQEVVGPEPWDVPAYSPDWDENDSQDALWLAAKKLLVAKPLANAELGDVLLFRMRSNSAAKHLGVQSKVGVGPQFIHAYSGHCVTESPLSTPWQRKIVARFEIPQKG